MQKLFITPVEVQFAMALMKDRLPAASGAVQIYGVPRGGVPVAMMLAAMTGNRITNKPQRADIIVDDIYDSGRTAASHAQYGVPFLVLFDKRQPEWQDKWLVMPWEATDQVDRSADDIVVRLLQYVGEDPSRGGLKETPQRVLKYFKEITAGYGLDPKALLKVFEDGAENVDEMVTVGGIPFYSMCEHHMAPFFGVAHIAYIPGTEITQGSVTVDNGTTRIVGLSKLVRVLDMFARRLQVQERMTNQIAELLHTELGALGVGVVLRARHLCMESRGVQARGAVTFTSALRGAIKDKPQARAEFLKFVELADNRTGSL